MVQPVSHMLAGNTQSGSVFHQADIINVGHLGATNTLLDPAHHIAEQALGVIIQLKLNLLSAELSVAQQRNG